MQTKYRSKDRIPEEHIEFDLDPSGDSPYHLVHCFATWYSNWSIVRGYHCDCPLSYYRSLRITGIPI